MSIRIRVHAIILFGALSISSCGTYRYYQPTTNAALFHNEGEFQIEGNLSSSGFAAKAAYALPANIGVIGMYNSAPYRYRVREGEIGLGYYSDTRPGSIFVLGGFGWGSNFEYTDSTHTDKLYKGNFKKPFVQFNGGIAGSKMGKLRGDIIGSLKLNYFIYDGKHLDGSEDPINSDYFLIEPAIVAGLGTKAFRTNVTFAFPFHPTTEGLNDYTNARTFPFTIGLGFRFIIGGEKDEE